MFLAYLQHLLRWSLGALACLVALAGPCRGQGESPAAIAPLLAQAWQEFSAGRFAHAEQLYRQAAALGDPSGDAELGIGWSLQRQARCPEARAHFRRARKDDPSTVQGLALCPPPRALLLIPSLTQGLYAYSQHPTRNLTSATTARLGAVVQERWLLSGAYRFSYFSPRDSSRAPWLQHDMYLTAGYTARLLGLSLHYGMLHGALSSPLAISGIAASDYAETSHHLGATARYSPFGDGLLAVALSLYPTDTVVRGELSWWLPLYHGLRVRPVAAIQWSGNQLRPSSALTLGYEHPRFGIYGGGKFGAELRPAQPGYEVIYNGPERIPYGLWAGVSGRPRAGCSLNLAYGYDRLQSDTTDAATGTTKITSSDAHYLTLSFAKEL